LFSDDLGWGVGTIFRAYVAALNDTFRDVPGGSRGFQILAAASRGHVASQLALGQHLGVDRTVMTYLIDDLESSRLIERRPDPADRRARRIIATAEGEERLRLLTSRRDDVDARLLAPLDVAQRASFRAMVQLLATRIETLQIPLAPCNESGSRGDDS
jgi:DNA-binding MarR family transcriptional regulator